MTTTVTSSTLTVDISETITLNGLKRNGRALYEIENISYIDSRIMTVTNATNGTGIISLSTVAGSGVHSADKVKYLRLTNLDDSANVTIAFSLYNVATQEMIGILLPAGKSIVIGDTNDAGDTDEASATVNNLSLKDIIEIKGKSSAATCQIEIYIAAIA
tara:strand:- start:276 stop:755 length:480 start_codon:yes stop_codon:yes gene_type:complete